MRAIVFERNGGPEARDYEEVPDPEPSDGELLVHIEAALEARKTTGKLILSA